ncbi:hypothetical protein P4H42_04670 [Paenibacillus macerans]|uniref:hypothetical protein n=1 Tax=Paenibacillus macerans TaxID=44252 RepID=UPI002DBF6FB2|nr:hypothetical protein [Paenibacillus macerans]MEC0328917.1 hypothetical protein [Paenibacillus macerans]
MRTAHRRIQAGSYPDTPGGNAPGSCGSEHALTGRGSFRRFVRVKDGKEGGGPALPAAQAMLKFGPSLGNTDRTGRLSGRSAASGAVRLARWRRIVRPPHPKQSGTARKAPLQRKAAGALFLFLCTGADWILPIDQAR